jgi:predicted RNase H-like HicB family nuclease
VKVLKASSSKKEDRPSPVSFERYIRLALSHADFSQNEDGSWTADIPVLPGCVTWGTTRGEAVEMAKDAAEAWVLTALRFGDDVPPIDGNSLQYTTDRLGAKV